MIQQPPNPYFPDTSLFLTPLLRAFSNVFPPFPWNWWTLHNVLVCYTHSLTHTRPLITYSMSRSLRDSLIGAKNAHRRGLSLNAGLSNDSDDNHLDLFSKSLRSLSLADDDHSDASVKLGRLSVGHGSAKPAKNPLDDLLSSTDGGKHDYDWLLTPPGTPLFPSSDGNESQSARGDLRNDSLARPTSTMKASRLSVSLSSESNNHQRLVRSSSVTCPSVSASQYSSYSNKSTSILNTSSASVSSYIGPSTPSNRSSSTARTATSSARPTSSRSSTPSKARPSPITSSAEKTRPSTNSRPSTPSSRPHLAENLISPASHPASRPSTPTRLNSAPSLSPASGPSTSVGRARTNGRSVASTSRPSSPSPRIRPSPQPIVLPDFSLETPPNLRTNLPDRPISAGRSRPGAAATVKGNTENPAPTSLPRRQSSPIVARGRLPEPSARGRTVGNGQTSQKMESKRIQNYELSNGKPVKTFTESTGVARSISKRSLDMAIRHMDIRNGANATRPLSGSTLFPQSIRSAKEKSQQRPSYGDLPGYYGCEQGNCVTRSVGNDEENMRFSAKGTDMDIYESSRYDTIFLKEDLKNTNWLHSIDDKSDQGTIFDHGFEPLPEPFDPL